MWRTFHLLRQILSNLLRVTRAQCSSISRVVVPYMFTPEYTEVDLLHRSLFALAPIIPVDIVSGPKGCRDRSTARTNRFMKVGYLASAAV
ncbi:hypothetical protein ASPFODRAFT_657187 [Aspergillus luchuensis CBS 106.47]|uniref:Secreted protein n=1 Tax=Aspergillus luchuensis (strain CBS 106.47) TaxID=1137211 RepID=A0A1M3TEZ1_ASPLC|nr:hypothetical protein ASPFODRAFT_657187 [Aspergillus luchuensis CBS 106.47]